ncbi:hypothetical protein BGZ83_000378 [Gryganskiella cystojenkinii]|nr:hypothetical protein BGZ83_000378 [Gryganskiella cystojenkinii]
MAENTILSLCFPCPTPAQAGPVDETMTNTFQQLCMEIGRSHHCQAILDVSVNNSQAAKKRLSIDTHQSVYNVTISGAYQNVMLARGALIRNNPLKPRLSVKISKTAITADPSSLDTAATTTLTPTDQASKAATTSSTSSIPTVENDTTPATTTDNNYNTQSRSQSPQQQQQDPQQNPLDRSQSVSPAQPTSAAVAPSFSTYLTVQPQFKTQVEQISISTKTSISLVSSHFHALPSAKSAIAAHARQEVAELLISGTWENAEAARLLLLAAIDSLQSGIVQEKLHVELKFQNMIGGRKRQDAQDLMARTRTSIYFASPFVQTVNKSGLPVDPRNNELIITGEPANVQIVKDALSRSYVRSQASAPACTRQVNIASRKLDWMLLNHRDKLRAIMTDNATFIAFPPLGASHPIIFVYGESRVNVERTIRTVMQLSSQFHSGSINLLTAIRDNLVAIPINATNTLSPFANISKLVSQSSGAEVEFRNNGFFIFGNEIQTRMAVQFLADIDFIKNLPYEVKFSVELANEHREFISGKKNGKINRIMKATGAKIKFDPCNEYNFYVDLSSTIAVKAVEALALLQEELPAEISFYVPETYHKRIIGVGGKNIQRIMKKFGVYVKFSNSEEFANLGGYFDNLDNVVARTPSKNALNLDNLKHAVMELVNPKDKDFVHHSLAIPKQYHLSLLSDHAKALHEMQEATNAMVKFPEKETGSDTVWISGPESLIQQATSMLLSLVDEQYVYLVPYSEAMSRVLAKPEFQTEVLTKMKNEWNMTLVVPEVPAEVTKPQSEKSSTSGNAHAALESATTSSPSENKNGAASRKDSEEVVDEKLARSLSSLTDSDDENEDSEEEDHVFIFKYSRNNEDYLQSAKELLVQYLIDNQIEVYDDEIRVQRPRSDSFAEAFPHFNSKILSSVTGGELPAPAPAFLNYSLFENAGNAFEPLNRAPGPLNGGQGMPGSMVAPDIRALFSQGPSPGLPPLSTSPPRWPEQHSRQLTSVPGSSAGLNSTMTASGPSSTGGQSTGSSHLSSQSPYNRLTSLPIDPWGTPGKQQPQLHQSSTSGYPGTLGPFRTPPPGMSNTTSGGMHGTSPSGFFSPNNQNQQSQIFSPEGPYGSGAMGYQTPGSAATTHLYSNNNSPVQGSSTNGFPNFMGHQSPNHQQQQQQQQLHHHHQPSPQRPLSGSSSGSRDSLQFLEEKMMSGPAFGPGYGPSLNSSNTGGSRNHPGQMGYPQQQHLSTGSNSGQTYPSGSSLQSNQYPSSRQRHSSHNSNTSHHTMFLGTAGLSSTGASSVNSDDISTEDEGDDSPFDDMRNKYRTSFNSQQYHQYQGAFNSQGLTGSSALSNRRGSVPSMGSMYSNQQLYHSNHPPQQQQHQQSVTPPPNVIRLSNSSSDLYARKSLVSAMARHSIGPQQDNSIGSGRSPIGAGAPLNLSGSAFSNDRDLFSSGLGGIIGGGTISHGNTAATLSHNNGLAGLGGSVDNQPDGRHTGSASLMGSTLSPSALPFLAESPLDRGWGR